jgi:hypothetical protein
MTPERAGNRVAGVVGSQLGLARALWWGLRGRTAVRHGDVALPYDGLDRAAVWTITAVGVVETVIVHVLVSWPPLRWSLLVLSVYGVLGLLAFDLTMRQHPHVVRGGELVLRAGHFRTVRVPLDGLTGVRKTVSNAHRRTLETADGVLALSFMGGTNVELRFSPAAVVAIDGRGGSFERVSFSAVDSTAAASLLRAQVAGAKR